MASTSARNCATRERGQERRDPGAEPAQPPQHVDVAPSRAGERVHGRHEHRQQQRAGEQRQHPARQHLAHRLHVALRPVLRARALVERGERPERRAAEAAEPVRVDRLRRPAAAGRQLAAARDPHRVVAASRAARPARRSRSGTTAARAGRTCRCPPARCRAPSRIDSATVRWRPMPGARGVVRPRLDGAARRRRARRGPRPRAPRPPGPGSGSTSTSRRAPACAERASRRSTRARASSSTAGPGRRARAASARPCPPRCRARRAPTAASRAATITICRRELPARRPTTFTSRLPSRREPLHDRARSAAAGEPARGEGVGHELSGRAVARASRRAGRAPAAAIRVGQLGRLVAVEQDVGGQTLPQRAAAGSGTRTSSGRPPRAPARTPRGRSAARSRDSRGATYNSEG